MGDVRCARYQIMTYYLPYYDVKKKGFMGKVDEETLARLTEAVQVQVGCLISITDKKSKAGRSVPAFTYRGLYVIGQSAN